MAETFSAERGLRRGHRQGKTDREIRERRGEERREGEERGRKD